MDESLPPSLHDVIHAFSSPSLFLALSFFYLRIFQSLPTPQLLPDPSCSSPLLFLLIYLLCAQNLLVGCLLILSSSRYCPQGQRIGCSSSSSSSSSRTPRTPLSPSNQNQFMLKNEIEGKEAKMKGRIVASSFMTSPTHRGRDSLSLRWRDRKSLSLPFLRPPSFCLSHLFI